MNKNTPRYYKNFLNLIIKIISKGYKGKYHSMYRVANIKIIADLFSKTLQTRGQWSSILKEGRKFFPRILYPMKLENKRIDFIQSMLSHNNEVKPEIDRAVKSTNTWKVKNILLNNSWDKKNVSEVIKIICN